MGVVNMGIVIFLLHYSAFHLGQHLSTDYFLRYKVIANLYRCTPDDACSFVCCSVCDISEPSDVTAPSAGSD